MPITGSLEVITTTPQGMVSTAQRVSVATLASIPAILGSNFSVGSVMVAAPVTVGTVTSAGSWMGTKEGHPASARLWVDIPFEQTAIGKALAAGDIDPLNPDGA